MRGSLPTLALAAALVLPAAGAFDGALLLLYLDGSTGLPNERPGNANDAGWTGVRFADVNGDGWPDLGAIGRKGDGGLVFLGRGDGTWTAAQEGIPPHFSGRSDLRFGDVDGDGHVDLVESTSHVFLGDGTGRWRAGPQRLPADGEDVALGDIDNDGDLDVAVVGHLVGGLKVFRNDGTARWTAASTGLPATGGGHKITLADVDRDGCLDVVATYWYNGGVWRGDCRGRWTNLSAGLLGFQGWGVDVGDANGDGHVDLAFGTFHGLDGQQGVRVFLGDGRGGWTAQPILLGASQWSGVVLEDVDGDGDDDLLAAGNDDPFSRVVLFLGDGAGHLEAAPLDVAQLVDAMEGMAAWDVDHNGVLDAGLAHYGNDGIHVKCAALPALALEVRVHEPRPGARWVAGGLREVRWVSAVPAGGAPGTADVELSLGGPAGPWAPLAAGLPNGGSATLKVPAAGSGEAWLRVTVRAGLESASSTVGPITLAAGPGSTALPPPPGQGPAAEGFGPSPPGLPVACKNAGVPPLPPLG